MNLTKTLSEIRWVRKASFPLTYAEREKLRRQKKMSFLKNTCRPTGFGGKLMVDMMNLCHRPLAGWGMKLLPLSADAKVLDCGCGGGANIQRLLKKCPQGVVKGIDYSPVSVEKARRLNAAAIGNGRCTVCQGSVENILFASDWFDAATAFETVYFWPDLEQCFREVYRVLKPDGTFLICNECSDPVSGEKWTEKINGMTVYDGAELKALMEQAGFCNVRTHTNKMGWLCMTGRKKEK